jgi:hypothetical protein
MAFTTKIRVPVTTRRKWKKICKHGDKSRIAEKYGISNENISVAFNHGLAEKSLIYDINEFFGLDQEPQPIAENGN